MSTREIVQIGASDLHRAIYVSDGGGPHYLVGTDNLCPDCTTPLIVLDGDIAAGVLQMFHDIGCALARDHGDPVISAADQSRVERTRRKYLRDALDSWSGFD